MSSLIFSIIINGKEKYMKICMVLKSKKRIRRFCVCEGIGIFRNYQSFSVISSINEYQTIH